MECQYDENDMINDVFTKQNKYIELLENCLEKLYDKNKENEYKFKVLEAQVEILKNEIMSYNIK